MHASDEGIPRVRTPFLLRWMFALMGALIGIAFWLDPLDVLHHEANAGQRWLSGLLTAGAMGALVELTTPPGSTHDGRRAMRRHTRPLIACAGVVLVAAQLMAAQGV